MADFVVSLREHEYQSSLRALRNHLEQSRVGYLSIGLKLPHSDTPVKLQLRCSDLYIIGFKGKDGWYHFDNEVGGWGQSAGVGSNYNNLADVNNVTAQTVDNLAALSSFQSGTKLDTKLPAIAAAVVSESLRFATVATYFTGLFNGFYNGFPLNQVVPIPDLKKKYFLNWDDLSGKADPGVLIKK